MYPHYTNQKPTTKTSSASTNISQIRKRRAHLITLPISHLQSFSVKTSKLGTVRLSESPNDHLSGRWTGSQKFLTSMSTRQAGSLRQTRSFLAQLACSHKIQYIHNQTVVGSIRGIKDRNSLRFISRAKGFSIILNIKLQQIKLSAVGKHNSHNSRLQGTIVLLNAGPFELNIL